MKKTIIILFGLLPLMLSAQTPKPPYTPQEVIALMPALPTIDGMIAYALGYVDFEYAEERSTPEYSDNSDLSRFMTEYKAVMAAYNAAMDKYSEELGTLYQSNSTTIANRELNQSRQELGGMNVNDFQNMSEADREKIAAASSYSSAQAQMEQMGISGVDVEAMSRMSEKEAEAYMNKKLSSSTGISEKELAKLQKMSDKELEAYLSRPENRGKREALEKMAMGAGQIQSDVQVSNEPSITPEDITEMDNLSKEIGLLWKNCTVIAENAKENAQMVWDTEYKDKYRVEYQEMLRLDGILMEGAIYEVERENARVKYKEVRKRISAIAKDYYRQTIPAWRNMVISVMTSISEEILPKTIRLNELTTKRDRIIPNEGMRIQSEINLDTQLMSVLQAYMEAGKQFSEYYTPVFYTYE